MKQVKRTRIERWGGIEVSRLGFGGMRFPTTDDGKIDRPQAAAMMDTAYQNGVNYFDTAYGYHDGESEVVMGEALGRYPRDSFYIADKLPVWLVSCEADVNKRFQEQLDRLGMDRVDFYLLHALNQARWPDVKQHRMLEQLIEKKEKGLIRYLGFSYHGDLDTFREIVDAYDWDFVQIQLNYADYDIIGAKDYYNKLREKDIPCLVMEPVRGGFLANPPESVKTKMEAFEGGKVSPAGWALRWCMNLEGVPVILSGMSTPEQVEENLETFSEARTLTPEQSALIQEAQSILGSIKSIPCTACRYCMDCSFGVDIPEVFRLYNTHQLFGGDFEAKSGYADLKRRQHGVDKCTRCGACVPQCPQNIDIPEKLAEVDAFIQSL